jgi:hypothetical protein
MQQLFQLNVLPAAAACTVAAGASNTPIAQLRAAAAAQPNMTPDCNQQLQALQMHHWHSFKQLRYHHQELCITSPP